MSNTASRGARTRCPPPSRKSPIARLVSHGEKLVLTRPNHISPPCSPVMPIGTALKRVHPDRDHRLSRCVTNFRALSRAYHVHASTAFEGCKEPCRHAARTLCLPARAKSVRHSRLELSTMPHANFEDRLHRSILHGYTLLLASRCAQVMIMTSSFSASELRTTSLVRSFCLRFMSYSRKTLLVRAKPRRCPCAIESCLAGLVVLLRAHHCCSPRCTRDRSRRSRACPCAQNTSSMCKRSACRAARPAASGSVGRGRSRRAKRWRPCSGPCSIRSSGGVSERYDACQAPPLGHRLPYGRRHGWCCALGVVTWYV